MNQRVNTIDESKVFQSLLQRFAAQPLRLALPEPDDERIYRAAHLLVSSGWVKELWFFETPSHAKERMEDLHLPWEAVKHGLQFATSEASLSQQTAALIQSHAEKRGKTLAPADLKRQGSDPLYQAGALLQSHKVDAVVAGCVRSTAEVIRACLATVGLQAGCKTLSGSFLLEPPAQGAPFLFADAAVLPEPSEEQVIDIASASVKTWRGIFPDTPPRLAFLSFSTKGSAVTSSTEKMARAAQRFKQLHPDVMAEGEVQFDAAYVPEIGQRKMPQGAFQGHQANIFIFPNLDAGNIAYKVAQWLGGCHATGPILQGSQLPYFDLSRGAGYLDIVRTSLIALAMKP